MSTVDQKLYTEISITILPLTDGINSRFKINLDNKSKEKFYNQRVPESKCRRTKTVDKDILKTYRFSGRKSPQPIIKTSDLPQEQGI